MSKTKILASTLFALLIFSVFAPVVLPATAATQEVQTSATLTITPASINFGEAITVFMQIQPAPPAATDQFSNLTLTILNPDNTTQMIGFSAYSNGTDYQYSPGMAGNYLLQLSYPGQSFANGTITYLPSKSTQIQLTVGVGGTASTPQPTGTTTPPAKTGVITFLTSSTDWTKANSPYTLSGPIVVSGGATLTIDSGVTVNLNGYYLYINGTLKAVGSSADNILIYGGETTFGNSSAPSTFQNVIVNSTVLGGKSLTVNNNTINSMFSAGDGSTITNNKIAASLSLGNQGILTGNIIEADVTTGNVITISNNVVTGKISTGTNATVSYNTINGPGKFYGGIMGYGYSIALTVGDNSNVSDNSISGGVSAKSSTIRNNNITGGGPFTDNYGRPEDALSALGVSGNSSVTSNVIWSTTGGYGLLLGNGYTVVLNNVIEDDLRVAGDALIENNLVTDGGIQVGDIFINAFNTIDYGFGNAVIQSNIITGGIWSSYGGGSVIIRQNLIANGISLKSQATAIQNNTFVNSTTAITLSTGSPLINYNNFLNYTQSSISLSSNPSDINATYNWWGTTGTQAVNLTIHDFKYDLALGNVTFVPILYLPNPFAPSTSYTLALPPIPPETNQTSPPTPMPTPTSEPTQTSTPASTPTPSTNAPTATPSELSPMPTATSASFSISPTAVLSPSPSISPQSSASSQLGLYEVIAGLVGIVIVLVAIIIVFAFKKSSKPASKP